LFPAPLSFATSPNASRRLELDLARLLYCAVRTTAIPEVRIQIIAFFISLQQSIATDRQP
jgi:hypothetical protein